MARPASGCVVERTTTRGRTYALRFRAYGKRHYVTTSAATRAEAETELANTLADIRRGLWRSPKPANEPAAPVEVPALHEFASAWVERNQHGVDKRTVEFWTWALAHVLEHFATMTLSD